MKKFTILTLTLAFLGIFNIANAQTEQNKVMMGGGFALSSTNSDTDETDVSETDLLINFNPKIGYFFADQFAAGLGIEFTYSKNEIGDQSTKASDLLAGPFARYYFPVGENSAFFAELDVVFGTQSVTEQDIEVSTTLFGAGVGPGFTIFANDFVGVEGIVRYNYIRGTADAGQDGNDITTTINEVDFLVGIQFYL